MNSKSFKDIVMLYYNINETYFDKLVIKIHPQHIIVINKMEAGLKHLLLQCQRYEIQIKTHTKVKPENYPQPIIIPIFSFIDQLISSLKQYANKSHLPTWGEFLVFTNQNNKTMKNIIGSWEKYKSKSLQCQLLGGLLACEDATKLQTFLKLRKNVIKVGSKKMLDEITLQHEDVVGIVHSVYTNPEDKKTLMNGIKKLFISYKMTEAKIYSCVFIEYALSLHQQFSGKLSEAKIKGSKLNIDESKVKNEPILIENHQIHEVISNFHSSIHEDNGLYKKQTPMASNSQCYSILQRKFVPDYNSKSKSKGKIVQEKEYDTYKSSSFNHQSSRNKLTNSFLYDSLHKSREEPTKRANTLIELKRIEETERENKHQKEGGYSTWIKMIDNNREFKERMLKSRNQENSQMSKDSINIIHDSLIKHSRNWD